MASRCRYCGKMMIDDETREHLVPRWWLRKTGTRFDLKTWEMNLLPVCFPCNQAKGPIDPLTWLETMPSNWHAYKLAQHMVAMGFGIADVFKALRGRVMK